MSALFSAIGLASAAYVYKATGNVDMTSALVFFVLMEALQVVQHFFIAENISDPICKTQMNQFLTILGYLHIMCQPYFTNLYFSSFRKVLGKAGPGEDLVWVIVKRLCMAQFCFGMARLFMSPGFNMEDLSKDQITALTLTKEWLSGPQMCTYKGVYHLAWSIPLSEPTYFIANMGLHSFMMFVPILTIGGLTELDSFLWLFGTGPLLASYISPNLHEQASIWCFMSIIQTTVGLVSVMLQGQLKNVDLSVKMKAIDSKQAVKKAAKSL